MNFTITKGKQTTAQKVVVYGPEGIGKSTFASRFPNPLFIDTEGSTKGMEVARLPRPTTWQVLLDEIQYVGQNRPCETLVLDTIDWAEQLCIEFVCNKHGKRGIEDFGYGNGYVYVKEEFGRLLNRLEDLIEQQIHVVLTAHAQIRKFEQPDELGAYDRYELKLGKKTSSQTAPLVKEWADMVLFANYKTLAVATDEKGKKHKAQGGKRVMYTSHHPCWDAKNRHGLEPELPFDYSQIAHCIPNLRGTSEVVTAKSEAGNLQVSAESKASPSQTEQTKSAGTEPKTPSGGPAITEREAALKKLYDVMDLHMIDRQMLQWAVGQRGYYPSDTPIENYRTDFLQWLPTVWDGIEKMIQEKLEKNIPF